jgi:hypothetical protein
MKINRGAVGVGVVGVAMLLALAGCNDAAIAIASKDVGPRWPFTVSEVRWCAPPPLRSSSPPATRPIP